MEMLTRHFTKLFCQQDLEQNPNLSPNTPAPPPPDSPNTGSNQTFIAPLHKKGNMLDPMNYRVLALSSCISKVYTAVLNTRLYQTMSAHNMHRTWQGGFTKNKRTTDNIFLLCIPGASLMNTLPSV